MTPRAVVNAVVDRIVNWRSSRRRLPNPVLHMFVQDVHATVVPYGPRRNGPIVGRMEGSEAGLSIAAPTLRSLAEHSHRWDGPDQTIPDVIRTVVQHLLWRGYSAFLIEEPTQEEARGAGSANAGEVTFQPLRPLPYGWMLRTPLGMVEFLGRAGRWGEKRRFVRFYPRRRVWIVDVPRSLGGRWGFWWMLKRLQLFSRVFPRWSTKIVAEEQNYLMFDVTEYSRLKAAYQAVSAARWGWSGRDYSTTYQTEFFSVYRTVTFHHALAVLREHVLARLNSLLQERLALDVRAELSGVRPSSAIMDVRDRMVRGDLALLSALQEADIT